MTGSITASFHDLALGRAREKSLKNSVWFHCAGGGPTVSSLTLRRYAAVMPTAQLVWLGDIDQRTRPCLGLLSIGSL
jgi:hypothetical protein